MHPSQLHVVTVISNPCRYRSRYRLYREFAKHMADAGVTLWTVELAFGDRPFEITSADNPHHIQLRTLHELWHKENLINVGVQHLTRQVPNWEYVAWIDADVMFARPDWATETLHQLQHHQMVQLFSHTVDLTPEYTPCSWFYGKGTLKPASWAFCHANQLPKANTDLKKTLEQGRMNVEKGEYGQEDGEFYWHPGFAWATCRDVWDKMGGLIDFSILGAADYLMAGCITGDVTLSDWLAPAYRRWIMEWKARADQHIRGDLGYVSGLLLHHWHGKKAQRGYRDRWRIFFDNEFCPERDLVRDAGGVFQLTDRSPGLRDDIRRYFRARNEDSIDT